MKLQGVSVIFALIVLPLILVLTYYIHLQVDTIEMQNEFDKKLLDSTYGAMSAFEINTANEDLSTVSDSLRTIIDASTNIFMNTLATNLGMSNASSSYLEPYIPAILYTLYDGYYITAPTRTPKILADSDGNAVCVGDTGLQISGSNYSFTMVHTNQESQNNCTNCKLTKDSNTGEITTVEKGTENHILYQEYINPTFDRSSWQIKYDEIATTPEDYGQLLYVDKSDPTKYTTDVNQAETEIKHVLKTYMPYSARYKDQANTFDIVAVYTLDNYLSIEGTIKEGTNDIYYTKSGYLIPDNAVTLVNINDPAVSDEDLFLYNENDAKKFIEDGNYVEISLKDNPKDVGSSETIISSGNSEVGIRLKEIETRISTTNNFINELKAGNAVDISEINGWLNNKNEPYAYTTENTLNKAIEARSYLNADLEDIKSKHSKARSRRKIKNFK